MHGVRMATMKITLTPELREFVKQKVRNGQYATAEEVVRGALQAMRAQEEWTAADVAELRREVMIGVRQMERGEISNWTAADIKAAGRRVLAARSVSAGRKSAARRRAS